MIWRDRSFMTVQTLILKGERYVVIREKDFRSLTKEKSGNKTRRKRRLTAQDRGDIAEAQRRLADANDRALPYASVRKRLGLR
jgi:hypothetical protein